MRQVSFDTHAAARKLERAGHSGRQAEAVVEVVSEATSFHMQMAQDLERIKLQVDNHMVTKADIANMATKDDIRNMATKDDIRNMATKDDIRNMATRDDVRNVLKSELIAIQNRWLLGVGSISFSAAGLLLAMLSNERLTALLLDNAAPIGLTLVIMGLAGLAVISRRK